MKLSKIITVSIVFAVLLSQINTQGIIPQDNTNNGYIAVPVNPLSDLYKYIDNFITNRDQNLKNWIISDIWQKENLSTGINIFNFTYALYDANNNFALIDSKTISIEMTLNILGNTPLVAQSAPTTQGINPLTQDKQITLSLVDSRQEASQL